MLHLHFSNRYETLADLFAERMDDRTGSPFAADEVIVPSAATQRWLTLELARRQGICANVRFSFLALWLWQKIAQVVAGVPKASPFEPGVLAWRLYAIMGDAAWAGRQARLSAYLQQSDPTMRFELATQVATLFEQYITYRPDWLAAWMRGEGAVTPAGSRWLADDEAWQAALWRELAHGLPATGTDPIAEFLRALSLPAEATSSRGRLPATAHVFGLPAIPPLHLGLLQALGRHIDLHVYALNPCREYWFESIDLRRMSALAAQGSAAHHEIGNPLLSAWGKQAQSQLSLLVEASGEAALDDAHYSQNPGKSLLAQLQNALLDMTELAPGSLSLGADDRSLEVHVCHSLTREIEVLQDRLLGLFATHEGLTPSDVLVATPDLEAAAPLIEAIFGTAPKHRFIPYAITGRARSQANPVARILLELLALASSRFTASAVFGLLQQPQVARQFGLDDAQLAHIHEWLQVAGVHWALDADHRGSFAVPASGRHSLADGLDRLFLGYALPTQLAEPYGGRLPAGAAEGSDALALGALWRFTRALSAWHHSVSRPLPPAAWPGLLSDALGQFLSANEGELDDLAEVQRALELLSANFQRSGLTEPLPLDVVRAALAAGLEDAARGGVPTGSVTFAAMSSLRRLPFRVVCVLGLNDGAFPSPVQPLEFDLMAARPRPGDRQRRHDDRNVFLDLLLAAREHLHLSHVGRSVRDNAPLPPSVLVSELLDVLVPAISPALALEDSEGHAAWVIAQRQARARLVLEHPLQPFAEAAFRLDGDTRLRSFQAEYAEALQSRRARPEGAGLAAALDPRGDEPWAEAEFEQGAEEDGDTVEEPAAPFITGPLPEPGEEWRTVSLQQLVRFFRNPCRYLLERRLGIELRRDEDELQDDEPFVADLPARTRLARRLLPLLLDGASLDTVRTLALAGTEVPPGAFGQHALEGELAGLQDLAERVAQATSEPCLPPHSVLLEFTLEYGFQWRLQAGFADLRPAGLVRHGHDELRAGDHLAAWLHHLVLCASPPEGVAPSTTWLGLDGQIRFQRCAAPLQVLQSLLELYRSGLREPLRFFPKSAWAYVQKDSWSAALGKWHPSKQNPHAEGSDAAYRLALRGHPDPLGGDRAAFHDCAHAVYDPLLACLE